MQDLQPILDQHSFEVTGLLRKHKIPGPVCTDTIKTAYDRKGEPFMMELLKIITPSTSNFLGLFEGKAKTAASSENITYDPLADPLSDETAAAAMAENSTTVKPGKFWSFFDNVFSTAKKAGETIGQFKTDSAGTGTAVAPVAGQAGYVDPANSTILYWVAGGFIALIVIILIFKK